MFLKYKKVDIQIDGYPYYYYHCPKVYLTKYHAFPTIYPMVGGFGLDRIEGDPRIYPTLEAAVQKVEQDFIAELASEAPDQIVWTERPVENMPPGRPSYLATVNNYIFRLWPLDSMYKCYDVLANGGTISRQVTLDEAKKVVQEFLIRVAIETLVATGVLTIED